MKCDCEFCQIKSIFYTTIRDREIDEFCANRIEKSIKSGDIVIRQGEPIRHFIYLKEGMVKLYRDTSGGRQIISIGKPMDFVSLLSVFARETYSYSVTAIRDSTVCILNMDEIKQLIYENGNFAMKLIATLNKASESILYNYLDMSQKRLIGRVSSVLVYFADVFDSEEYDLPVSRKEIAQLIGMSTENVIRTISELRKDKILDVFGKRIYIRNKGLLVKISNFS